MPRKQPSPRHSGDQPAKRQVIGDSVSVSSNRAAGNETVSECEDSAMSNETLNDPLRALLVAPGGRQRELPVGDRRPADLEMTRVLKTAPLQMASDPSNGAIAHWKHGALHDVVEPMTDHVIMAYPTGVQRLERRTGKSVAIGTARSGVVTIIPAGSSARWDIPGSVDVIQLYLPHTILQRVAREADAPISGDLLERTGHPDPVTSGLLMSAADALGEARRLRRKRDQPYFGSRSQVDVMGQVPLSC